MSDSKSSRVRVSTLSQVNRGGYIRNKHTGIVCFVIAVDETGGCTLLTKHGKLYYDFLLIEEHWEPLVKSK